jgi:signal transduction histidine kinase
MKISLKQFGGLATDLKGNLFWQARIKLTAFYVIIIAFILIIFSTFLYDSIKVNLSDASEENFSSQQSEQRFVAQAIENVRSTLFFSDLGVLIFASILSYLLAGKTLKPIKKAMEIQKKFAADASHELRTPLAIMRNENEVALRNTLLPKETAQAVLKSNLEEIQKMTDMVDDLLSLARSTNGNTNNSSDILNISNTVAQVTEKISKLAQEKGISINYAEQEQFSIKGNKILLERMLINIFQNSLQHTPAGGTVTVVLNKKDKKVVIKITDTGEGIDEKHLPFVFDRFYKGSPSSVSHHIGNGLGLAIVKEIVDNHNGTVSIQSKKDKGTSIIITFPIVA